MFDVSLLGWWLTVKYLRNKSFSILAINSLHENMSAEIGKSETGVDGFVVITIWLSNPWVDEQVENDV